MERPTGAAIIHQPRRAFGAGLAIALVCALLAVAGRADAAAGDVRLPGLGGGQLTSADLDQGVTLVVVWASWSPRCRDIVERVDALASGWSARARVVTVDFQEEPADVERFLAGKSMRAPVYLDRDGEFSKAHAVATLPGLIVFRDGEARYQGKLPADPDSVISDALR
jgi:thiol-disulfide isomerase/thioredoxin